MLSGLTRVRQFSQDDAHIFVMESQIGDEVERLLRLVQRVYGDFGLDVAMKLSTRPAEFLGEIATWDHAEAELRRALDAVGLAYTVDEGDGAFYGPKIDFDVIDALGRKWQCATIQLDYQLPQRFDLTYIGADNAEHRPVVIHRAIFGSFERFMALLLETLRRRVPAVDRARAGDRAADRRPPRRRTRPPCATGWRPPGCGPNWTTGRRRSGIRSAKRSCRRSRTCWSSATARWPTGPCRCAAGRPETRGRARWTRSSTTALDEVRRKGRESREQ